MKKYLLTLATFVTVTLFAQDNTRFSAVYSDPGITNMRFTDDANSTVNTDALTVGTPVNVQFVVSNNDRLNAIPKGTSQVVITLGTVFLLGTDLANNLELPLKDYFHWQLREDPGSNQLTIYGDLYRDLPANFTGIVKLSLIPYKEGVSTVTSQFTISNHNSPSIVLSDIAPMNNFVSQGYSSKNPVKIKFTQFDAMARGCLVDLSWTIVDENKEAVKFIIETSQDGINFTAVKTVFATGSAVNNILLETSGHSSVYIRVKAMNAIGQFVYSDRATVNNICNTSLEVTLYPSLVEKQVTEVMLIARKGIFDGKYTVRLLDMGGKEIKITGISASNQLQVKFNTGFITAGTYFINLTGENGQVMSFKMVKQ